MNMMMPTVEQRKNSNIFYAPDAQTQRAARPTLDACMFFKACLADSPLQDSLSRTIK
jgi:hypothetical protein